MAQAQEATPPLPPVGAGRLPPLERGGLLAFLAVMLAFALPVAGRTAFLSKRMGDLDCYLRAAWAVRAGQDLYAVTDDNGFHYNYPPLLAILAAPLADPPAGADPAGMLPFAASVLIWYFLSLACLALAAHLLARALEEALPRFAGPAGSRRWWALRFWPVLACLVPVGHTLMRGQVNLLVLLLLCGGAAAFLRGRSFRAGLWLAGAICIKIIPAFLLLFPLWRRDGRFLAGCALGLFVGLLAVPVAVLGPARTRDCYARLREVLVEPGLGVGHDESRAKELTDVTATDSQSILAVLHNSLHLDIYTRPAKASPRVRRASLALGGAFTVLTLLAAGWRRPRDPLADLLLWGALIVDMLLLCPVTHLHYFCLTFPLAAGLLAHWWQARGTFAPGAGLLGLFAFGTVANVLPHLPGFNLVRDLGLAMYAALAVWLTALVVLWKRTRKAAGAGSEGLWRRLAHGTRRLRVQPYWEEFAGPAWVDKIMEVAVADRFHAKQGRTIVRWTLDAGGKQLVVYLKRHYRLPWWRGLMALFHPEGNWSPALREWENLEWARAQGLPVPVAAAGGEFIGPWGRFQSFLAVEELTGMLGLHEAVPLAAGRLAPGDFERWKRGLIAEMASLVLALHTRRYFHKDLYLCHFYVAEDDTRRVPPDWRGRVRLIDLHRLARHPWTWPRWRAKDLGQLLYSSDVPGVTARDRVRFWRDYLNADGTRPGALAGWLRGSARLKAWNYHRHDRRKAAA